MRYNHCRECLLPGRVALTFDGSSLCVDCGNECAFSAAILFLLVRVSIAQTQRPVARGDNA